MSQLRTQFHLQQYMFNCKKNTIFVFTDGAAKSNPGPAGAAAILTITDTTFVNHTSCHLGYATNNQAELYAIWLACILLYRLHNHGQYQLSKDIHLCTDSHYVYHILQNNSQIRKNIEQVTWLRHELALWHSTQHLIHWHLIPGHKDIQYNIQVDNLASQAADLAVTWLSKQKQSKSKPFSLQRRPIHPSFPIL